MMEGDELRRIASDVTLQELHNQGWASGSYMSTCTTCGVSHIADKRALRCINCAADAALAARRPKAEDTQRSEASHTELVKAVEEVVSFLQEHMIDHHLPTFRTTRLVRRLRYALSNPPKPDTRLESAVEKALVSISWLLACYDMDEPERVTITLNAIHRDLSAALPNMGEE